MQIQAPAVMPKWDYALNKDDELLMVWWEKRIMQDAMAEAKKRGTWVTIYWDAEKKDVVSDVGLKLETIGQANAQGGNLYNMRKYYAIKYL